MQVSHAARSAVASFDDPNLVSAAGLVPIMLLAEKSGLRSLADAWLSVPTDKSANAGAKVASLVAGMVAGADSIDDMALLRPGGIRRPPIVTQLPFATQAIAPGQLARVLLD